VEFNTGDTPWTFISEFEGSVSVWESKGYVAWSKRAKN
jgi:hypothetical protein